MATVFLTHPSGKHTWIKFPSQQLVCEAKLSKRSQITTSCAAVLGQHLGSEWDQGWVVQGQLGRTQETPATAVCVTHHLWIDTISSWELEDLVSGSVNTTAFTCCKFTHTLRRTQTIFECYKTRNKLYTASHKLASEIHARKTGGIVLKVIFKARMLLFYPQVNVYGPIIILENNIHKEMLTCSCMYHGGASRCHAYGGRTCCAIVFSQHLCSHYSLTRATITHPCHYHKSIILPG